MSENAVHVFCDCRDCVERDLIKQGVVSRLDMAKTLKDEKMIELFSDILRIQK